MMKVRRNKLKLGKNNRFGRREKKRIRKIIITELGKKAGSKFKIGKSQLKLLLFRIENDEQQKAINHIIRKLKVEERNIARTRSVMDRILVSTDKENGITY